MADHRFFSQIGLQCDVGLVVQNNSRSTAMTSPRTPKTTCLSLKTEDIGLQVAFSLHEDRQQHSISLLHGDRTIPIFESIEGASDERWPASPPLQQLSVEELRPGTEVALLVGMAGKSHWSISIEPVDDRIAFVFDVACRSREATEHLGSGYSLSESSLYIEDDHFATMSVAGQLLRLQCDRESATNAIIKKVATGIRIEPTSILPSGTTRWRYTLELPHSTAE
jgi:hypothetical protein